MKSSLQPKTKHRNHFSLRMFSRIKLYKQKYRNSIFCIDKVEVAILVIAFFLLVIHSGNAAINATKVTTGTGNWSTNAVWSPSGVPAAGDNVTVNHSLTLNSNITISGTYTFNAPVTDATGGTAYTVTINTGGTLDVKSDMAAEGAFNVSGTLIIRTGVTLTVGAATFASGSSITIEDGGALVINGAFINNSAAVLANGDISVAGKVTTNSSSKITGTGTLSTTLSGNSGSITNNGTVFGSSADCTSGTCSIISPCNASATQPSITSSASAICTGGAPVTLSAVVSPGVSTYQWQSSPTGVTYSNISGATNATYSAGPAATTYYQLKVVFNAAAGGCNYTTNSYMITVNTKSTGPTSSSGTSTICSGTSATLGVSGGSIASDAVAAWYQGACPGFTEDWGGNSSPYTTMNGTTVNSVSGGYMNVSALAGTPTDPQISMFGLGSFNPNTYKYIKVRYRVNSGNPGNIQIYFTNSTFSAASPLAVVVSSALITDGNWNIAIIDMSSSANWATGGNITGWRFDYATDVSNMDIDYITLTAAAAATPVSPVATTSYYVRYEGLCNSTPCAGTPVTVTVKTTPTITSTTPASKCGTGTLTLGATASAGTVNWYDGSGTLLATGNSFTTPNLLATTIFYVDATNNGCTTPARTSVTATITACAITWVGTTSNDWNTASNWSPAVVPTSINRVTIPAGTPFSPQINAITASTSVFVVNAGATLTITSTGTLNVYSDITNHGTLTTVAGSTLGCYATVAQAIAGVSVIYDLDINNTSGGVSLLTNTIVKGTISLINGVLTTNSNLTINFDNGGNIGYNSGDLGSISGNIKGTRSLTARTHYIAAPFSGITSAQVQATTPLYVNPYWKMYTKTFANQGWGAVMDVSTAMPLGTGFSLSLPNAASLAFTGTYTHGSTLTGATYSNAVAGKFILVGNPYPSTLDWSSSGFTKTNVANAIYLWNAATSSVSSYVGGVSTNGASQYIPAMQAFMVTTTGTTGNSSVSIDNTTRTSLQNPSFLRVATTDETIRIKVSTENESQWDDAVVHFTNDATLNFDSDWDAYKIISTSGPSVYTTLGDNIYSINSVPNAASLPTIEIGVKVPSDGNYNMNINNSDPLTDYILIDKKLGTQNILSDKPYAFSSLRSDDVNRFELQLKAAAPSLTTGIQSSGNAGLQIMSSTKGFVILTDQFIGSTSEIEILDVTGKTIKSISEKTLTDHTTYIPLDITDGSYLVKMEVEGNVFTQLISMVK